MKTVVLRDETFQDIAAALEQVLNGQNMAIDFLISRHGLQSDVVEKELEILKRLEAAQDEFLNGPGSWRTRPG